MRVKSIRWEDGKLFLLDQSLLPDREEYLVCETIEEVAKAIKEMKVRGAPAIGVAAAFGLALVAKRTPSFKKIKEAADLLSSTRPTAVNLFWAIKRMLKKAEGKEGKDLSEALENEAVRIFQEDIEVNRKIGEFGASLLESGDVILTHCNAGALATAGYGTALGVIRSAIAQGKEIKVFATETRPLLQGARLTVWELKKERIPHCLITDLSAGYFMKKGEIKKVIVGADRIALNGDVANKIGTYSLAVLAKENGIPFYVAAPASTFDFSLESGNDIPIEERDPEEVRTLKGVSVTLPDTPVRNAAFDVTPASYITLYITELGLLKPPFNEEKFSEVK